MDEARKMQVMEAWLGEVCQELKVDYALIEQVRRPLLKLIKDVAHGPSRPGAPMTAFVIGLAAAGGADVPAGEIVARIEAASALIAGFEPPAP